MAWSITIGGTSVSGRIVRIRDELNGHREAIIRIPNTATNRSLVSTTQTCVISWDSTVLFRGPLAGVEYYRDCLECKIYDGAYEILQRRITGVKQWVSVGAYDILSDILTGTGVYVGDAPTSNVSMMVDKATCYDAAVFLARACNKDFWSDYHPTYGYPRFWIGTRGSYKGSLTVISVSRRGIDRSKKRDKVIVKGVDIEGYPIEGSAGTGDNVAVVRVAGTKAIDKDTLDNVAASILAQINTESSGVLLTVPITSGYNLEPGDTVTVSCEYLNIPSGTYKIWAITKKDDCCEVEIDRMEPILDQQVGFTRAYDDLGVYPVSIRQSLISSGESFPPLNPEDPDPIKGQHFYRTDLDKLFRYNGTDWEFVAQVKTGTSLPDPPTEGELFYRTDEKKLYLSTGPDAEDWVVVSSGGDILTDIESITSKKLNPQTDFLTIRVKDATSDNPLQDSPTIVLRGSYWDTDHAVDKEVRLLNDVGDGGVYSLLVKVSDSSEFRLTSGGTVHILGSPPTVSFGSDSAIWRYTTQSLMTNANFFIDGDLTVTGDINLTGYLKADGSVPLTAPWAANNDITGLTKLIVDNLTLNGSDIASSGTFTLTSGATTALTLTSTQTTVNNSKLVCDNLTLDGYKLESNTDLLLNAVNSADFVQIQVGGSNKVLVGSAQTSIANTLSVGSVNISSAKIKFDSSSGEINVYDETGDSDLWITNSESHVCDVHISGDLFVAGSFSASGLNADTLDNLDSTDFIKKDGSISLSNTWNAGNSIVGVTNLDVDYVNIDGSVISSDTGAMYLQQQASGQSLYVETYHSTTPGALFLQQRASSVISKIKIDSDIAIDADDYIKFTADYFEFWSGGLPRLRIDNSTVQISAFLRTLQFTQGISTDAYIYVYGGGSQVLQIANNAGGTLTLDVNGDIDLGSSYQLLGASKVTVDNITLDGTTISVSGDAGIDASDSVLLKTDGATRFTVGDAQTTVNNSKLVCDNLTLDGSELLSSSDLYLDGTNTYIQANNTTGITVTSSQVGINTKLVSDQITIDSSTIEIANSEGTIDVKDAANSSLHIINSTTNRVVNVDIDGSLSVGSNISVGGTVDGVDISAHAANANAHHAQSHAIVGSDHTASGLTAGYVIRATGATTFAWQQLQHGDLGGIGADQHHAQYHASTHHSGGSDALSLGSIAGTISDSQHGSRGSGLHSDSHARQHPLSSYLDHTGELTDAQHGIRGSDLHSDSHARSHDIGSSNDHYGTLTASLHGSSKLCTVSLAPSPHNNAHHSESYITTCNRSGSDTVEDVAYSSNAGVATTFSRGDHVHYCSNKAIAGLGNAAPMNCTYGSPSAGTSPYVSRQDHVHYCAGGSYTGMSLILEALEMLLNGKEF